MTEPSHPFGTESLPLVDHIALRLGRMAMWFAAAEALTRFVTLRVLDVSDDDEKKFETILAELPFRKLRATLVAATVEQRGRGAEFNSLRAVMREIDKLEERRNALIHSAWIRSDVPLQMARVKKHVSAAGVFRSDEEVFGDLEELDAFVERVRQSGSAVTAWYARHFLGVLPQDGS